MTELIEELKRLHAEATPGPWVSRDGVTNIFGPQRRMVALASAYGTNVNEDRCAAENAANAALILALRNALPAIITLLEAGQACADDLLWAAHQNDHGMVLTTAEVAEVRTSIAFWSAAKGEI